MAENNEPKLVNANRNNPRRTAKICEYMTYSGREAFKRLRTNAQIALGESGEKKCRIIGITSAQPSEGKSTVSVNLAYSLAELGKSVILVDGDMRRPSIHDILGESLTPGVSNVINGSVSLNEAVIRYKSTVDSTTFDVIPGGDIPENPSELLNSNRFRKLLEVLAGVFEYIVVDLPPVNAVIDAVNVSKYVDGMIVVIREDHCPRYVLAECMEQLRYARVNILGMVMNGCIEGAGKHYQYKKQSYGDPYSK